jgi:hypothetical protein
MCNDSDPAAIDVHAACQNLRQGRALVSMGLLVEMNVDDRFGVGDLATGLPQRLAVHVEVLGPSWVRADRVELFANGVRIRDQRLKPRSGTDKANLTWRLERPTHDVHLVAIATGPGVRSLHWATPRPYQPTSPAWNPRVIGSTNPIWIDADGDGHFTSARGYARQLIERTGTEPDRLLSALASYDEAVAAQAASLCLAAGRDIDSQEFRQWLRRAAPSVQKGFDAFSKSRAFSYLINEQ